MPKLAATTKTVTAAAPEQVLYLVSGTPIPAAAEVRRGFELPAIVKAAPIDLQQFQSQVNIFLTQMSTVVNTAPEKAGKFRLEELEISAGIVLEAKGEVKLALLANAEAGGSVNAGLKFVFRRA